jgi:Leucine-rich repeat (LRR) protein
VGGTAITELPSSFILLKNLRVLSLRGCEGLSSISSNKLLTFPLMPRRRSLDPMGMLERSLSSLLSLTKLDLSYCNLRSIPDTFGCLPLLRDLNLRGNNFVCLPKSIIRLSNLERLILRGCTALRLLPELPLNIRSINANDCTSLETLPIRPADDFHPNLNLINCVKLIGNQSYNNIFLNILRHSFKVSLFNLIINLRFFLQFRMIHNNSFSSVSISDNFRLYL